MMRGDNVQQATHDARPSRQYLLLDDEFDVDDEFEAMVLESIQRCGTIDVHPNGWGIHDGLGVNTDNMHYSADYSLREINVKEAHGPKDMRDENKKIASRKRQYEIERKEYLLKQEKIELARKAELDELIKRIAEFPHVPHDSGSIAYYTATEFMQFGAADAIRRGISNEDWIWKRSRFLAGYK